jgi:nicotinate dehydrogenase subunit A
MPLLQADHGPVKRDNRENSVFFYEAIQTEIRVSCCNPRRWERFGSKEMAATTLKVNGNLHSVDVDPETPLLYVLSDELGLRGPKFGCGLAQCGACTVLLQGDVVRSCVTPLSAVKLREVTTLEGLGTPGKPHPLQQAFIDEGAAQCGFCLSGVILSAKVLLDEQPRASNEQVREALSGVLCRCFTHTRMIRAIKRYQARRA